MTFRQTKAPPHEGKGPAVRMLPRTEKTNSDTSIANRLTEDNPPAAYNGYRLLCFWRGEAVYLPPQDKPTRVISVLRHGALWGLTPRELASLREELGGRLIDAEEEYLSEIGHGMAYEWPHLPAVIRREKE